MNILKIGICKTFLGKRLDQKILFQKKYSQKFFIYININKIFKIDFFFNI